MGRSSGNEEENVNCHPFFGEGGGGSGGRGRGAGEFLGVRG